MILTSALLLFSGLSQASSPESSIFEFHTAEDSSPSQLHNATIEVNRLSTCAPILKVAGSVAPDTCIPNKHWEGLYVLAPWPRCANGTLPFFATYDSPVCDAIDNQGGEMQPFLQSGDLLHKCSNIKHVASFSFWCEGYVPRRLRPGEPEPVPDPEPDPEPEVPEPKNGGLIGFPDEKCRAFRAPFYYPPDKCLTAEKGLQITLPATCANGTQALFARFKGSACDPTDEPFQEPLVSVDELGVRTCLDTSDMGSMAFWCDGVPGVDLGKAKTPKKEHKKSNLGLILGLTFGLGGLVVVCGGLFVAYNINYAFRTKVNELFGRREGAIALY